MTPASKPKRYRNLIAGEWTSTGSNGTFENINPADTTDIVGVFPAGGTR